MSEIVSSCASCLAIRTDPIARFRFPDEPMAPDARFWWVGQCGACDQARRFKMLGSLVPVATPQEEA
jgi:hypothetical protein